MTALHEEDRARGQVYALLGHLLADLGHICETSGLGARIEERKRRVAQATLDPRSLDHSRGRGARVLPWCSRGMHQL